MEQSRKEKYESLIQDKRKTARLILISGLHGSGKSTLLAETSRAIREERPTVRIVHADPDSGTTDGKELLQVARALGVGPSALFIDGADAIKDLIEALSAILAKYTVTVFITAHNAKRLENALLPIFGPERSNELAIIRMEPLSYGEFLFTRGMGESRDALDLYCRTGGLPQSLMVDPESPDAREFTLLRANSFLLTEIIEPHSIRNPGHLRLLLELVARSTGDSLSSRQVCLAFSAERITISPQAVLDYLGFCADSGLLVSVPVLDIDKKKVLDSANVWYFGDAGLRAAFVRRETPAELSRAEENLAFLRLVDDGWTVSRGRIGYGKRKSEEVSFVCERAGKRAYIQIIANAASPGERLRKREALLAIRDAWPRYLVDADSGLDESDGIRCLYIRDLLFSGIGE